MRAPSILVRATRLPSGPAFGALSARALGMAGALAMSIAILRTMPKSDAGLVVLLYTLLTLAAMLARFGSDNLALLLISQDRARTRDVIHHAIQLTGILSLPSVLILVSLVLVHGSPGGSTGQVALAAAVGVFPAALTAIAGAVLRSLGRVASGAMAELGSPTVLAAVGIAALGAAGLSTPLSATWALTGAYSATAAWALWLIGRSLPRERAPRTSFSTFVRSHWRRLLSFFLNSAGFFLFAWLPVLTLGYVISDARSAEYEVALFNAGSRLAQFASVVAVVQVSYLSQQFAYHHHRGELSTINRLAQRAALQSAAWAFVVGAALLVAPGFFLGIFGGYDEAAGGLRVLVVGTAIAAALGPVNGLMLTCGLERAAGRYTCVILALSVVVLPLLARWGHGGVAVGASVFSVVYAVACLRALRAVGLTVVPLPFHRSPEPANATVGQR